MTRLGKCKPNDGHEKLVADALDKMRYVYRCHVKFVADNGVNIFVDFLIENDFVAIEIDGSDHSGSKSKMYDEWRDDQLRSMGIFVVRISNDIIEGRNRCRYIREVISECRRKHNEDQYITGVRSSDSVSMDNQYRLSILYRSLIEGVRMIIRANSLSLTMTVSYEDDGERHTISFSNTDVEKN